MPPSSPARCSRAPFSRRNNLAELVDSIKEHGIIQPLIVRETQNGKYELIAGERRWRASGILGLSTVPAIIREASDKDVLELALIENLQRENLQPAGRSRRLYAPENGVPHETGRHRQARRQIPRRRSQQHAAARPAAAGSGHAGQFLHQRRACQGAPLPEESRTSRSSSGATSSTRATPSARRKRPFRRCSTRRIRLLARKPSSPQYKKISGVLAKQFGTPVKHLRPGRPRLHRDHLLQQSREFTRILGTSGPG